LKNVAPKSRNAKPASNWSSPARNLPSSNGQQRVSAASTNTSQANIVAAGGVQGVLFSGEVTRRLPGEEERRRSTQFVQRESNPRSRSECQCWSESDPMLQ